MGLQRRSSRTDLLYKGGIAASGGRPIRGTSQRFFGPPWRAALGRSVLLFTGCPRGRWASVCTAPGPTCVAPARPDGCELALGFDYWDAAGSSRFLALGSRRAEDKGACGRRSLRAAPHHVHPVDDARNSLDRPLARPSPLRAYAPIATPSSQIKFLRRPLDAPQALAGGLGSPAANLMSLRRRWLAGRAQ